jgi:hypothetical protein
MPSENEIKEPAMNVNPFIPVWIIAGPFIGLLILAFSFKGQSAMGGTGPRLPPRERSLQDASAPLLDPIHPNAARRIV